MPYHGGMNNTPDAPSDTEQGAGEDATGPAPLVGVVLGLAIGVPTILGVYPVTLALGGLGFGPAEWIAGGWQLASAVTWAVLAVPFLFVLGRKTNANLTAGLPPLTLEDDGPGILLPIALTIGAHAFVLVATTHILALGRGRPPGPALFADVLLLYAPLNMMTILGCIAAAIVAAEHRGRLADVTVRRQLERELNDARQQVVATLAALNGPTANVIDSPVAEPLQRISVTIGNRSIVIEVGEIDWIEASSYYVRLHTGVNSYLLRQSMNSLAAQLDAKRFARIHRSTIVNLDRIAELQPHDRRSYLVTLKDGRRLLMSRRRRQLLDYLLS